MILKNSKSRIEGRIRFLYLYDMRLVLTLFLFFITFSGFAQSMALARNYFKQGEFEKSLHIYEKLYQSQKLRLDYLKGVVENLQELERFDEAETYLTNQLKRTQNQPQLYVELGYNFEKQGLRDKADKAYQKAINAVVENVDFAFNVGRAFRDYSLLDQAVEVYEMGMQKGGNRNFGTQLAQIYGEQGKIDKMFERYLDILEENPDFKINAQRYFSRYISEDPENDANEIFRRVVLRRSQKNPDVLYNDLLSWFFVQQNDFRRAFAQEKAIYNRSLEKDFNRIIDLGNIAVNQKAFDEAREIIEYCIANIPQREFRLYAYKVLMDIEVSTATIADYPKVQKQFESLLDEFGSDQKTYQLQIQYNHFLAFKTDKKELAIQNLRTLLKNRFSEYEEAEVKMELADVLVIDEKFNQALIFYSQIQNSLPNHNLSQEARFKVAQTSYYKGDFDWALTQLDVLKKSTSQLIANDAMKLSLLIRDNTAEDSTQTALKMYARADLLELRGQDKEAIAILSEILETYQGESIEDEALVKQAKIFEKTGDFEAAEANYLKVVQYYSEGILADEALFYLAKLYEIQLNQPEAAKKYYEKILFEHEDSVFFVEARRKYRMLRGDAIN